MTAERFLERRSPDAQAHANIGNWCLDIVNDRLYWSEETCRIFGLSKEGFLPYYRTFYQTVHPDDRAAWEAHRELFIKGDTTLNIEHRIVRPSGDIRHVRQVGGRIVDMSNRPIWLTGTVEDITGRVAKRKKMENLSMIIRRTAYPVIVVDTNGQVTWVNPTFEKTFGYRLPEVISRRPGTFLEGPETDQSILRYVRAKFEKREPFEVELLQYARTGQKYWMLVQGQPIFDKNGHCLKYMIVHQYITSPKPGHEKIPQNEDRQSLPLTHR